MHAERGGPRAEQTFADGKLKEIHTRGFVACCPRGSNELRAPRSTASLCAGLMWPLVIGKSMGATDAASLSLACSDTYAPIAHLAQSN